MSQLGPKDIITKRIALMFKDGDLVNLGVGIPGLVPKHVPAGVTVWLHAENGIIGSGPPAKPGKEDPFFVDASKLHCTILPGGCTFDTTLSFGIIRGGHLDYTVLGALQVDIEGNLANWMVPGGPLPGMGGAMDLVTGAKKVVVATTHSSKDGSSKIMKRCTFPLTGVKVVDYIVTELALVEITPEGAVLRETGPGVSAEEVVRLTDAPLIVPKSVPQMAL
ncbi:MAG: 3-oxoacid CoA-transferase subunit B [Deltaproteobacteria bacterium]|nr:3-oxoacid CoA-transferase subunit B [Deltaproteobacteria bacterium]